MAAESFGALVSRKGAVGRVLSRLEIPGLHLSERIGEYLG
jgi:hypothetical protein